VPREELAERSLERRRGDQRVKRESEAAGALARSCTWPGESQSNGCGRRPPILFTAWVISVRPYIICPVPNGIDFGSPVTGYRPPLSLQDAHARLLPRVRVRAHVNMGPQEGRSWHVAIITFLGSTIHGIERIMPGTRSSRWAQKMPPSDCYSTLEIEIEEAGCRCHPKGSGLQPGKCSDGKDSRIDTLRLDGLYDR
jgi:hypothetical protein